VASCIPAFYGQQLVQLLLLVLQLHGLDELRQALSVAHEARHIDLRVFVRRSTAQHGDT
jgi:hypothetical protein